MNAHAASCKSDEVQVSLKSSPKNLSWYCMTGPIKVIISQKSVHHIVYTECIKIMADDLQK